MRVASASAGDENSAAMADDASFDLRNCFCYVIVRCCVCCECGACGQEVQMRERKDPLRGCSMGLVLYGVVFSFGLCVFVSDKNVTDGVYKCQ